MLTIGKTIALFMKSMSFSTPWFTLAFAGLALTARSAEDGFSPIFDGRTLTGWHVSAKTGHSAASNHQSGGQWVVEDGALVGSQDIPGNGGIVVTDERFGDFEVALEMRNDFGPDSGLFLRSTDEGVAWQAMIDYHAGGNLMGVYGEGLGGTPHVRNFSFTDKVTEIDPKPTGAPPTPLPVLPESWATFWRHGQWNELRARIVNNPPTIATWINGVKFMQWTESEKRHAGQGGIALQVHGGGDLTREFVRYRNLRVKRLDTARALASLDPEDIAHGLADKQIVAALRRGGLTVFFRHANTDATTADTDTAHLENLAAQRALTDKGRAQAIALGQALRALRVPVGPVLASRYGRTLEMAKLAGLDSAEPNLEATEAQNTPPVETQRRAAALRQLLATAPEAGKNRIILSHRPVLQEAAGKEFGDLAEGEAAVFQPLGADGFRLIARIKPIEKWTDWAKALE